MSEDSLRQSHAATVPFWRTADRRVRIAMAVFLGIIATVCAAYMLAYVLDDARDGFVQGSKFSDFMVFYASGPAMRQGGAQLLFNTEAFTAFQQTFLSEWTSTQLVFRPWLYPPTMLLITVPLAFVPYVGAALLMQLLGVTALWLALERRVIPTAAVVLSPAFALNFTAGQYSALWAACLIGGLRLSHTSPVLSGLLFALLSLKPQLGLLLPVVLLAAGSLRTFVWTSLFVAAVCAISVGLFGTDTWLAFLRAGSGAGVVLDAEALTRVGAMMGSTQAAMRLFGAEATAAIVMQGIVALGAMIAAVSIARSKAKPANQIMALAPLVLLASPYWMSYDLVIVCAAVAWYVSKQSSLVPKGGEESVWYLVWVLPFGMFALNRGGFPVAPLLLGVAALVALRRLRAETPTPQLP